MSNEDQRTVKEFYNDKNGATGRTPPPGPYTDGEIDEMIKDECALADLTLVCYVCDRPIES